MMLKRHKFLAGLGLAMVAAIVAVFLGVAPTGGLVPTLDDVLTDRQDITAGQAFTVGDYRVEGGWTITHDKSQGIGIAGTVTNVSTKNHVGPAQLRIKFMQNGAVVDDAYCVSPELEPGESGEISGYTDRDHMTYDSMTAEH